MSARELIFVCRPAVVEDVEEVGDVEEEEGADEDEDEEIDADVDDVEAENLRNSRRISKYSKK